VPVSAASAERPRPRLAECAVTVSYLIPYRPRRIRSQRWVFGLCSVRRDVGRLGPAVNVAAAEDVTDVYHGARPTRSQLVDELVDVARDLPVLLTAPLYRSWHLRWGATPGEAIGQLPGDDLMPRAQYRATRAITIDAPPHAVWPWLVQVGCVRAGFYGNDLLDNLGHPSATTILPAFQGLKVGQWVPMSPAATPTDRTALKVHSFDAEKWLLWTKPDSTWVWSLTPSGTCGTRLVTRIHAAYDWTHPLMALFGVLLMEFGDFAMLRRMLRGIKQRAGNAASPATRSRPVGGWSPQQCAPVAASCRCTACSRLTSPQHGSGSARSIRRSR
jgi:hypothetical protein